MMGLLKRGCRGHLRVLFQVSCNGQANGKEDGACMQTGFHRAL